MLSKYVSPEGLERLTKTYAYVFFGIMLAIFGNVVSLQFIDVALKLFWPLVILEFVVLIGFMFMKNLPLYLLFTAITGATLAPTIYHYLSAGMASTVFQALAGTAVITGGLSLYAIVTKRNFLQLGPIMFWVLLGLVVVSLINMFLGSSLLALLISCAAVVIFSIYMIIDTQSVLTGESEPLEAAMGLYLNILNLFVHLLQILGMVGNDE